MRQISDREKTSWNDMSFGRVDLYIEKQSKHSWQRLCRKPTAKYKGVTRRGKRKIL